VVDRPNNKYKKFYEKTGCTKGKSLTGEEIKEESRESEYF
jgi:hypothetical protein